MRTLTITLFDESRMVISPDQVVENIQRQFVPVNRAKTREIGLSLYAIMILLGGPFFLWGSHAFRRRRVERRLQKTRIDLFQDIARLRGIIYAGYYGHWQGASEDDNVGNPVLDSLGYTLPGHRVRDESDDLPVEERTDKDLPGHVFVPEGALPDTAEVIVIGSGAGGAVAAANLARQGYEVLIIEAGSHYPSSRISLEESRMTARLFKDGAVQTSRNRDIVVFQGQVVGGSTVINNGICLRVKQAGMIHEEASDVLANWAALGAPVPESELTSAYADVEGTLGVAPLDTRMGRHNGHHLLGAWHSYAAASSNPLDSAAPAMWFKKNWRSDAPGNKCVSCGYCNTGCPYGRKNAMPESYLTIATGHGARILADASVSRILWQDHHRARATGVELSVNGGRKQTIHATKGVVVAAGAIASSNILRESGLKHSGHGMSLNIACPVPALMPYNVRAWDEDQMATYVDRADFLIESHFQPPMSMATLVPGWFEDHFDRMLNYNKLASAGVLFPADRLGRIKRGKLRFELGDAELDVLRSALATLTKVHFANGALEVYPALLVGQTLHAGMRDADIDDFYARAIVEPDDVVLSSSHPQGGNAINADPDKGVIDLDHRVHGTDNVYVCDASVFPSCIRVNAQLTTMAMSHRATHGKAIFG
ncbi:GMC family oxidoreductase [Sphingorhabdus sp. Alg239-R122]|uniref:GMC family oxidoreductase N-terminal domain-containing protein n=1 Tax=Sphingorhabdus sp. Alg239-R122 TaxID=2305989 RepID=UPI001F07E2F6|nr:GMC family oxidoreductase [Sphingorhabdus sp. Alg239-R122]